MLDGETEGLLTFWGDAVDAQSLCAHDGALALAVVVHQQRGEVLIRVVWYALRRRDCQKLDMPVLSCKVLQAGLQNLAGHHPACAQKPPAQHALDITGARSWHGWPQLTLDMFGMP